VDFRTIVDIKEAPFSIGARAEILFVGSCFADNIGKKMKDELFRVTVNPFGVMYNPASVLHTIQRVEKIPDRVVITLGTNHVYILNSSGEIVDNCQKRPQRLFTEKTLSVEECTEHLQQCIDTMRERNANVKIVMTVSPIRYAKYGYHGSRLSKATLLLAVDNIINRYGDMVYYFPAYEIMNDELRDYRFYAPDMLHPSEQAVEYIWQQMQQTLLSEDARGFIGEWKPIKQALNHKPFNADSEEYKAFMEKTREALHRLEEKYGSLDIDI